MNRGFEAMKARGRRPAGELNKTEAEHANDLEMRLRVGEILHWEAHPIRLILGKDCTYEPDFLVLTAPDCMIELHEVKGGLFFDDAKVKIRVAAAKFPYFTFKLYQKKGGAWTETAVS